MDRYSILLDKDPPIKIPPPEEKPEVESRTPEAADAREDLLREALRTGVGAKDLPLR